MVIADARPILEAARAGGYAVPAFNVANLEFAQAVVGAAEDAEAPVFVAVSEGALTYGAAGLTALLRALTQDASVPVVLHLDHGKSLPTAEKAVRAGFTSIMLDGSQLPYDRNVELVRAAVVAFAGVAVEGELGHVGGGDDPSLYTEPTAAASFVEATGCTSLAVSVGTSHGAYKFAGEPTIDLERLEAIAAATPVPLVLHGASAVYADVVASLRDAGGTLAGASGLPDSLLEQAVKRGIAKVNVDTDLRLAFTAALRRYLHDDAAALDPKKYLAVARDAVRALARRKIDACGVAGRAKIS